ncbi:uncharacterized protein BDR25DRAFT_366007 [Lindgomyces ingoldianus]|uniref:Uncharacterized protein n=1 Tax=Lindgomyces ingoldianus TaxID=673940 RepID=A0ACB6R0U7_9PLEO|nr:uncharacterized protein BDR25DRAFT_366007 [Lindgomyces ingoldianus]KAF2472801.1 hypothetical protein BDR25DRAFT_366007 [Lindgomyces ingoldianus]
MYINSSLRVRIFRVVTSEWGSVSLQAQYQRQDALRNVLSPDTLDALYQDVRLHGALLGLADRLVYMSSSLGDQYDSEGLKTFAKDLTQQLSRLREAKPEKKKRGVLEDLGNMITGGGAKPSGQQGQGGGGALAGLGNALGLGGGNDTGGLGGLLQQGISSLGDSLIGSLGTPALFLGIGLGMGTASGLNLSDMQQNQAIATRVAATFNAQATGINQVAQNLGNGLTAQLTPSLSNVTSGTQIGMAAFSLAQGIGQGSASGLKLTTTQFQPSNGTDIMAIAGNLGLGVSQPIASSIDLQKLFNQAGANGGQLAAQLPQIAAAAGQGLGEGASAGLGLSKSQPNPKAKRQSDPNQINIPQTVGDFSRGLSQSFIQSSNLTQVLNSIAPGASNGFGNVDILGMIIPIASGAGKGIGEGAAIGLGLQQDPGLGVMPANSSMNQSTEMIVEQFSKGLVSSFLANGTATKALANLTSSANGLTNNLQASKVAEGLARGLIEGGVNAVSMVGGIQNVLSGNFSLEQAMNMPSMGSTNFNDSVGGAAVAFGRGLAGEGTLLISNLITNSTKPSPKKRSVEIREVGVVPYHSLNRRADSESLAISSNMLSSLAQAGTNAITCQGFGGIAAIGLGLINSGTLKINLKNPVPLDNRTLDALPKEPIVITSEGNRFEIKIQNSQVKINEMALVPFAVVTALHIALSTFAFFYALPVYLAFGAILRLSVLINHPFNETNNRKWRKRILLGLFLPTSVSGLIFGIVGMGKAMHFQTAHGIFGLLTFLLIPPTAILSIRRLNTTIPLPSSSFAFKSLLMTLKSPARIHVIPTILVQFLLQFSTLAWILGFSELRSISLCVVDAILTAPVVVGAAMALLFAQVGAMSLVGLRVWFEQRIARSPSPSPSPSTVLESRSGSGNVSAMDGSIKRSSTFQTFAYRSSGAAATRPQHLTRNTEELSGREDSKIGWPSNVRKFGDATPDERSMSDPFHDPVQNPFSPTRRVYDEKLGFEREIPVDERDRGGELEKYVAYQPRRSEEWDDRRERERNSGLYPGYAQPRKSGEEERDSGSFSRYQSFSRPRPSASGEEIRIGYPSMYRREDLGR